ncbi:hypothetical protein FF38_10399 [Lucilia cuprina]|uniref:Uncharacterized protein n=1 Tax=Lucilia cuprina TaxID=7375 RepID=A0A0L0C0I2_LUCCU|nr:hypothetical protein FF38_10399 [Lucilia cuprina]
MADDDGEDLPVRCKISLRSFSLANCNSKSWAQLCNLRYIKSSIERKREFEPGFKHSLHERFSSGELDVEREGGAEFVSDTLSALRLLLCGGVCPRSGVPSSDEELLSGDFWAPDEAVLTAAAAAAATAARVALVLPTLDFLTTSAAAITATGAGCGGGGGGGTVLRMITVVGIISKVGSLIKGTSSLETKALVVLESVGISFFFNIFINSSIIRLRQNLKEILEIKIIFYNYYYF